MPTSDSKRSAEQAKALTATLEPCNAASNERSKRGLKAGKTRQYHLQKSLYHDVREEFALTVQAAIRRLTKVGDACASRRRTSRADLFPFRKHAARHRRGLGPDGAVLAPRSGSGDCLTCTHEPVSQSRQNLVAGTAHVR